MKTIEVVQVSRGIHCTDVVFSNNRIACSDRPEWAADPAFPTLRSTDE